MGLPAYISTHAPLAGRDRPQGSSIGRPIDFNPRAPCGARQCGTNGVHQDLHISTHAPLAGRDLPLHFLLHLPRISTHAPLAGRDNEHVELESSADISTHAPLAGRDVAEAYPELKANISTHAPLAGRDTKIFCSHLILLYFNPRAPCGARQQKCTNHYAHFCDNRQISDAFAQNAACQGILLLFDAGKPCGFWVRTAQVISAHLCFAL